MGSSVSVQKHPESSSKLRLSFGSKTDDKLLIPSSPVEPAVNGDDVAVKPATRPISRFGSKDEAFFDSQPWLDSDCEDDFLSVNGDFTPSRGSTPVHHNFSTRNQQVKEALITEGTISSVPEPSPTSDKKKRLSELFKESLRINEPLIVDPAVVEDESSPYVSQVSSERTPSRELVNEGEAVKSSQCCLPMLLSCRSFSGRKKRASSAHIIVQ